MYIRLEEEETMSTNIAVPPVKDSRFWELALRPRPHGQHQRENTKTRAQKDSERMSIASEKV